MPNYQISFKYGQFNQGWSEIFYSVDGRSPAVLVQDIATQFGLLSMTFRDVSCVLQAVSVRDQANTRNVAIFTLNLAGNNNFSPTPSTPDVTNTALRCSLNSTGGGTRQLYLRGLPDLATTRNAFSGATTLAGFGTNVVSYLNRMVTYPLYLRRLIPAVAGGPPNVVTNWQQVNSFGPAAPGDSNTVVTLAAGGIIPTAGTYVYFRGLPRPNFTWLQGRLLVLGSPGALQFSVAATWRGGVAAIPVTGTQFRASLYNYYPLASPSIVGLTSHKTGRPTLLPRGRRSRGFRRLLTPVPS